VKRADRAGAARAGAQRGSSGRAGSDAAAKQLAAEQLAAGIDAVEAAAEFGGLVEAPGHYTAGAVECIDALQAMAEVVAHIDHCTQTAVAYLWRWRRKDGARDLAKAQWYVKRALVLALELERVAAASDDLFPGLG